MKSLEDAKRKLRTYSREDIIFDGHALLRMEQRGVDDGLVVQSMLNPQNLVSFREYEAHHPRKRKASLHFKLSNSRTLYVLAFLTDKLIKIKTCNIDSRRYKKRLRRGRWQG